MVAPSFKKATDTDAGDATKYGAPDIKYALDVLDGSHATDRIQASVIEGSTNFPDVRRFGGYFGGLNATASLEGFTSGSVLATPGGTQVITYTTNVTDGKYTRFQTGATSGNSSGHQLGTDAIAAVVRGLKLRFKCRFRVNQSDTAHRIHIGLKSPTTAITGDTPLATVSGVILHKTAAGTIWNVMSNAGGATASTQSLGNTNTNIHTIEFRMTAGDTGIQYSFDGGTFTAVTTPPASGTVLFPAVWIETSAAAAKSMDIWYWMVEIGGSGS